MKLFQSGQQRRVASDDCRHISEILPDVLARYGLAPRQQIAVTELTVPVASLIAGWTDTTVDTTVLCPALS